MANRGLQTKIAGLGIYCKKICYDTEKAQLSKKRSRRGYKYFNVTMQWR